MKSITVLCLILSLTLTTSPTRADQVIRDGVIQTSLVRILAHPEQFNGKRVLLDGYLKIAFEESGLYLSKDDADHLNTMQALWVGSPKDGKDVKYPKNGFVMIVGTVRYTEGQGAGHLGSWFAELSDIEQIVKSR
jgi:hypothetical protein